jgi:hypothetical protein
LVRWSVGGEDERELEWDGSGEEEGGETGSEKCGKEVRREERG